MSDYSQIEDYSAKDNLTTGDAEKLILGSDIDGELDAISTAIASKIDKVASATSGNLASFDSNGGSTHGAGILDSGYEVLDEDDLSSDSDTALPTQQSVKAYADALVLGPTSQTPVATTSGTSVSLTPSDLASTVKRIHLSFNGVSTNGSDDLVIQIGPTGGVETSGYLCRAGFMSTSTSSASFTDGFGITLSSLGADCLLYGVVTLINTGSDTWVGSGTLGDTSSGGIYTLGGVKAITGGTLAKILIKTQAGSETFDAGSITVTYD